MPGIKLSSPTSPEAHRPAKVLVGIYVLNIGMLDMSAGSFTIDFYLNLVSDRPYSIDNLEFINGYVNMIDKDEDDPYEKAYRVKASFFTNFNLRSYPFNEQRLPIEIEDRINDNQVVIRDS
jgi:hypothetical protein